MTSPSAISPISVAQTGTPRTKFLVPSIGSMTQQRGLDAGPAVLLAEHRVPWPGPAQHVAQRLLGGQVGIGDRGQVGLGLHGQVERTEPAHGDVVRRVSEDMGEPQVVVETRHAAKRYR